MSDDWLRWHTQYDDPNSPQALRLAAVQGLIHDALDRAAPGPIAAISICAGQGRDLLGVLVQHPRAHVTFSERDQKRARTHRCSRPR